MKENNKGVHRMSKVENKEKNYPAPLITSENKVKRKKNPGVVPLNRGIPVEKGLNLQDVPREYIHQHMINTENYWREKFNSKYGKNGMKAHQSF